jgi:hypothetical protein
MDCAWGFVLGSSRSSHLLLENRHELLGEQQIPIVDLVIRETKKSIHPISQAQLLSLECGRKAKMGQDQLEGPASSPLNVGA